MRHFHIYRASAGSGKTYTLTREYLKLALTAPALSEFSPRYFRHILAITFTNAATSEMKKRVIRQLERMQHPDAAVTDPMSAEVLAEMQRVTGRALEGAELTRRAKAVAEELLHHYNFFSVSTIDSFNQQIINSFKRDLGLPFNFELALDKSELAEEITDRLLDSVGEDSEMLTSLIVSYIEDKISEDKNWNARRDLLQLTGYLFDDQRYPFLETLQPFELADFEAFNAFARQHKTQLARQVRQIGAEALSLLAQADVSIHDLYQTKNGIGGLFSKAANFEKDWDSINIGSSHVQQTIGNGKWTAGKASADVVRRVEGIKDTLLGLYSQLENLMETGGRLYTLCDQHLANGALIGLLNQAQKIRQEIAEEKNILHISQMGRMINQVVVQEPAPYIFERIGERYHHILMDEFQDTSVLQWHNMLPLLINALNKQLDNLIVGDVKQSIYSFRGGTPALLDQLPAVPTLPPGTPLAQDAGILNREFNNCTLDTNFRSAPGIIGFNNLFFTYTRDKSPYPTLQRYYADVVQQKRKKAGGKVDLRFFDAEQDRLKVPLLMAEADLRRLHNEGYAWSQMALLVRRNREGVQLATHLLNAGIPVVSGESLLLERSPAVRQIVRLMHVLSGQADHMAYFDAVFALLRHFPVALPAVAQMDTGQLAGLIAEKVKAYTRPHEVFALITELTGRQADPDRLLHLTLYEMAEQFTRLFQLDSAPEQRTFLYAFMHHLLGFSRKVGNMLSEFLDNWETKKESLSVSLAEGVDAVRIMTIHKSKGLEFPVVIMPFGKFSLTVHNTEKIWLTRPGLEDSSILLPPFGIFGRSEKICKALGIEEEKTAQDENTFVDGFNMLYVALTRAVDELYVYVPARLQIEAGWFKAEKPRGGTTDTGTLFIDFQETAPEAEGLTKEVFAGNFTDPDGSVACPYVQLLYKGPEVEVPADHEQPASDTFRTEAFLHTNLRDQIPLKRGGRSGRFRNVGLADLLAGKQKGNLLHYAFENIRFAQDIPRAVRQLLREGLLSADEAPFMESYMQQVVSLPEIAPYFDPNSGWEPLNEQEIIYTPAGEGLQPFRSFRPDRILLKGQQAVLLDYKTGLETRTEHITQLKGYAGLIAQMGYQTAALWLVYTEKMTAVPVKP